jgi:hypothetical protein
MKEPCSNTREEIPIATLKADTQRYRDAPIAIVKIAWQSVFTS